MIVTIVSKHPYRTWSVEIKHDLDDEKKFQALKTALTGIGWKMETVVAPPFKGVQTDYFAVDGTDVFNGWTFEEAVLNIAALKRLFKRMQLPFPVKHKLTFMEQE